MLNSISVTDLHVPTTKIQHDDTVLCLLQTSALEMPLKKERGREGETATERVSVLHY
jgi:hypothetical protein